MEGIDQRKIRYGALGEVETPTAQQLPTIGQRSGGSLGGQPTLANPGFTRNKHYRRRTIGGSLQRITESGQLGRPADQRSVPRPLGHGLIIALKLLRGTRSSVDQDRPDGLCGLTTPG